MTIIGRNDEKNILKQCLKSNKPEFIAVYGRRRVGKTYLIKQFFNQKFTFYATGINNTNLKTQLSNFENSLRFYGLNLKKHLIDWFDAFTQLRLLLESDNIYRDADTNKRIVFMDELPWFDCKRSNFKAALDYFWNSYGSTQNDLVLITCGSSTSWIIRNMVKDEGGFYNRLTTKMHLLPFKLKECLEFSNYLNLGYDEKQVTDCYMVFGGIPYYWNLLNKDLSLTQNIDALCFQESGPLYDEYQILFKSLFTTNGKHREIIEALMKKSKGMQRKELSLIGDIGDGKTLTNALEELCECGFIRVYDNYETDKYGKFYQIIDPFILFVKNFMMSSRFDSWSVFVNTPLYFNWAGHAFEIVCLNHMNEIKRALGIGSVVTKEFSWKSKCSNPGAQIDLLICRKDHVINLCEIKYSINVYTVTKEYEEKLKNKLQAFYDEVKPKDQVVLTLISFNGVNENTHSEIVRSILDYKCLFFNY